MTFIEVGFFDEMISLNVSLGLASNRQQAGANAMINMIYGQLTI